MKNLFYWIISVVIVIFVSIVIMEFVLQCVPVMYKNLPKDDEKTYIYILGESSSWGHPYEGKISFSKIISYYINNKIDDKDIEMIMLAKDGQRLSQQYFEYYKYKIFHPFKRGILLVYMGTNDWSNNLKEETNVVCLKIYLFGFLKNYFKDSHNFKYEYEKIIFSAKQFGDEVYLSTILGNYAGCRPNDVNSLITNNKLRKEIFEIDSLIIANDYTRALEKSNNLLKINDDKSQIWYRIGKIYEGQKKIKDANEAYKNAVEYGNDPRPSRYQNEIIKELALKYNMTLVDLSDTISKSNEIIGYNYFIDIIHPTIKLHMIIAKEFIKVLLKEHRINIINSNGGIDPEKIKSVMNFRRQDMFAAYRDALGEIFFYSFYNNITDSYNIPKIEEYIGKLKELDNDINAASEGSIKERENRKDIIYISEMLLAYIQGNNQKVKEMLNDKKIVEKIKFGEIKMQCWWAFKNWIINFMYKIINNEVV
ncbi:MAG: hypothetical protein VB017_06430 [Endomicrobiaceae bacterium]|nr:hypothetical protein [Endomicrobiaceae bacterium]